VAEKISNKNQLGLGIYMASDISRILGIPLPKVSRYLNNYWDKKSGQELFKDTYSWSINNKIKAVNFYVMIELYVFIQLSEMGISKQKIFKTRQQIAKDFNLPYPFASQGILTDGQKIWYEYDGIVLDSDGTRQTNLKNIIKAFAKRIEFNTENHLAQKFYPAGKNKSIVVDPHHQFGLPVIEGTNINTDTIFSMYDSGENITSISALYDISEKQIKDIIKFSKDAA